MGAEDAKRAWAVTVQRGREAGCAAAALEETGVRGQRRAERGAAATGKR